MRHTTNTRWSTRRDLLVPTLRRYLILAALAWALAPPAPVRAQTTIERWVDAATGSDSNNCTRIVEEGANDGDPDTFTIVVTSQRNGANQVMIQLRFVTSPLGAHVRLPVILR